MTFQARLLLEDGTEFTGRFFTTPSDVFGEIVFNTAMSGYQEVLTDPSYSKQCVVMTYPMIGNYGINKDDVESNQALLKMKRIILNAKKEKSTKMEQNLGINLDKILGRVVENSLELSVPKKPTKIPQIKVKVNSEIANLPLLLKH